jgi:N-acetylglutamate synthase-like GNAT family acetyltransferase
MHSYNSVDSPGTEKETLQDAHKWMNQYSSDYFQVIEFEILEMEVLKLEKKEHLRARYQYENGVLKDAVWLVP